jgi:UDP-galactopyranose mutase
MQPQRPLIVLSHLRWDFVFQRPQHLMTRFAEMGRRVFFVEEPMQAEGKLRWERLERGGVTAFRPRTPLLETGFSDEQIDVIRPMLEDLVKLEASDGFDLWFYTPMALPLVSNLRPNVLIYDCMDELSAFKFAPPALLDRERELLKRADVVFTGGPSLYEAKKNRHSNCHCFSSSVDAIHFGKAASSADEHPEQKNLPGPRLGFFGVIDERFDVELLRSMADARPDWQFVMVGPVVKISPDELPRNSNIHYFGQRTYAELPEFLAGWDVALLPFARNESTKFISPTKTLEYMAACKPIVSTPITDVFKPYGDMVGLGDDAESFLAACEKALAESESEREERLTKFKSVLARTNWDETVRKMAELIDAAASKSAGLDAPSDPELNFEMTPPVVVIGAGPTGLSAAYHLGSDALLLEANDRVGGWCRSVEDNGFTFDFAGHIMFSNDPYVHEMYEKLLGDNVHWQDREAWIYSKNVFTRYPFQGSLYGLPPQVIKECIMGAIEARFGKPDAADSTKANGVNGHSAVANGSVKTVGLNGNLHANGSGHLNGNGSSTCLANARLGNGTISKRSPIPVNDKGDEIVDCCADGVAEATAPLTAADDQPKNFEEFIYKVWGAGIAKHFAIPYNRKIWAVPLDEMETSWLGGRVPMPDLGEMIEGALSPKPKPMGPNARFGYPLHGGFQALMDGFLPHLKGPLKLNTRVKSVSPSRRVVTLEDGTEIYYEQLISTMPLPVLIKSMGEEAPSSVRDAAAALRHTSVRCVNLGFGRENLTDKHWIYYPEDTVFHRIFVQGNASPHCNAPGGFGLTCEITYGPNKPLPCDGDQLIRRCIDDCIRVGIAQESDSVWAANMVDMPHAYVVYDHARPKNVRLIRDWLEMHDIHLAGRYSEWEYYNSDHAFLAGKKAAEAVRRRLQDAPVAVS